MLHGKTDRSKFKRWVQSSNYDAVTESLNNAKKYLEENPHIKYPWEKYLKSFTYRFGQTILGVSVETNDWKMLELLLNFGFDPMVKQRYGGNLLVNYLRLRTNSIEQEPIELLLDRGVHPFYNKDDVGLGSVRFYELFPSCCFIQKFPELFHRFDTDEFYSKFPQQMLLTGIHGHNLSYVKKALETLARKNQDFKWLYNAWFTGYIYTITDEEIIDVILDHIPSDDLDGIVCDAIFHIFQENISFLRVLLRRGYNLNRVSNDNNHSIEILIRRSMSYLNYDNESPTLEECDSIYYKYQVNIIQLINLGVDVSLNRIPVQGKLKDLLQRDVVSFQTLALRSCNSVGIELSMIPRVLLI